MFFKPVLNVCYFNYMLLNQIHTHCFNISVICHELRFVWKILKLLCFLTRRRHIIAMSISSVIARKKCPRNEYPPVRYNISSVIARKKCPRNEYPPVRAYTPLYRYPVKTGLLAAAPYIYSCCRMLFICLSWTFLFIKVFENWRCFTNGY